MLAAGGILTLLVFLMFLHLRWICRQPAPGDQLCCGNLWFPVGPACKKQPITADRVCGYFGQRCRVHVIANIRTAGLFLPENQAENQGENQAEN